MTYSIAWAVKESDGLGPVCIPAPRRGADVCSVCHGWCRPGYGVCFPCGLVMGQVSEPCWEVAVMSVYRPGSPLHRLLRGYKDLGAPEAGGGPGAGGGPADTTPSADRPRLSGQVGALASRFIWERGPRMAPAGWDALVTVPSTAGRRGPHPLEAALGGAAWLGPQVWAGLLGPGPGAGACGHRRASDDAFVVTAPGDVRGARLLLVDDTWTTGARAQSAASALNRAGAEVVAVAVLGRIVTPVPGAPTGRWWLRHAAPRDRDPHRGRPGGPGGPGGAQE